MSMLREKPRMGDIKRRKQGVEIVNENKNKEKSEKESKRERQSEDRGGATRGIWGGER